MSVSVTWVKNIFGECLYDVSGQIDVHIDGKNIFLDAKNSFVTVTF